MKKIFIIIFSLLAFMPDALAHGIGAGEIALARKKFASPIKATDIFVGEKKMACYSVDSELANKYLKEQINNDMATAAEAWVPLAYMCVEDFNKLILANQDLNDETAVARTSRTLPEDIAPFSACYRPSEETHFGMINKDPRKIETALIIVRRTNDDVRTVYFRNKQIKLVVHVDGKLVDCRVWILAKHQIRDSVSLETSDILQVAGMPHNIVPFEPVEVHQRKAADGSFCEFDGYIRPKASESDDQHPFLE